MFKDWQKNGIRFERKNYLYFPHLDKKKYKDGVKNKFSFKVCIVFCATLYTSKSPVKCALKQGTAFVNTTPNY